MPRVQILPSRSLFKIEALLRLAWVKFDFTGCCDSPMALPVKRLCVWSQRWQMEENGKLKFQVELWRCEAVASWHLEFEQCALWIASVLKNKSNEKKDC